MREPRGPGDAARRRFWVGTGPATGPGALVLLLLLLAAGCGGEGRPGEDAGSSTDTVPPGAGTGLPDTGMATARNQTGAPAADAPTQPDTLPGDTASPEAAAPDTARPDSTPADTMPADTTAVTDTAVAGRFYVRVRGDSDPDSVARRHGVRPLSVVREPTKGFYAALTRSQVASLESDTLVRYVAREIHGPDTTGKPPIRRLPVRDTGDGGG